MKRLALVVLALGMVSACGTFSSSSASSTTTEPDEIGGNLVAPTTRARVTTTTVAAPKASAKPAVTNAGDACPTPNPKSEATLETRIKIVMTTSKTCPAHRDDLTFTMTVTNVSSATVHYDTNQLLRFSVLAPQGEQKHRWEDDDCAAPATNRNKPAADLAPNASVTFTATYPGPSDYADRETCRKLETGRYEVHGLFLVCDASYTDGYCDTAKDTQYQAALLPITLGA